MTTDPGYLDEIRRMARADHAWRLPREHNPYPEGSDRAAAWAEGWSAEDDRIHGLDEEIVKLPRCRVRAEIVDGDKVLAAIERNEFAAFKVSNLSPAGDKAVRFESREARERFPRHAAVAIRVTYDGDGGMFD